MDKRNFEIIPPLLNSASPWATSLKDLTTLYDCPYTGAITVRTSLIKGFKHDPEVHQYAFFSPITHNSLSPTGDTVVSSSSLNTLGYSPITLQQYLDMIANAADGAVHNFKPRISKPIILSVTGAADEIAECYSMIADLQSKFSSTLCLMMEINLSCPNIPDKPPPAYDEASLVTYLKALSQVSNAYKSKSEAAQSLAVLVGIKTAPYTYQGQYNGLIGALKTSVAMDGGCPIHFITATNTLGSCLFLTGPSVRGRLEPAINSATGEGIGGMAGAGLHPLALGNVSTIRKMLDADIQLSHIKIIGVGGVNDALGYQRMVAAGADAVALATGLGKEGVAVFEKIAAGRKNV